VSMDIQVCVLVFPLESLPHQGKENYNLVKLVTFHIHCSLVNMYKELVSDIAGFKMPDHGYLMGWAKQGGYLSAIVFGKCVVCT